MLRLDAENDWTLLAGTVMPDHGHILFQLGERLNLGRVVAKFKTLTRHDGFQWQANFFEHRLRPDESEGQFARYIFMNPYRAKILGRRSVWPWWVVGRSLTSWDFGAMLEEGLYPPAEWLDAPEPLSPDVVGETAGTL